jgi:hypothetical protein
VPSALIDLDAAPAVRQRPGRSRPQGRSVLAVLSLILIAVLGPAAPPVSDHLRATLIAAGDGDGVFVSGDRLYVVDAASTPSSRGMRIFRLPDGRMLGRTNLPIPEPVTGVMPLGATTLVTTTVGQRPAIMAIDTATNRSLWWQFGLARGVSAAAGLVLLTDDGAADDEPFTALDLRTGDYRWQVPVPEGGQVTTAGLRDGAPQWLVTLDSHRRLDTYDALTGKHLATASGAPLGPLAGPADDLFVIGGSRDGVTAYALPGLTTRWQITPDVDLPGAWVGPSCGAVLCVFRPALVALDPATGKTRWTSDRWNYAERAGDYLAVSAIDGAPDQVPLTLLDPATGRVRADLGGWHQIFGSEDGLTYVVHPGRTSLFGRFDPARTAVRILGTTDRDLGQCDAGAGAVVCHLTGGPVAIWQPGS